MKTTLSHSNQPTVESLQAQVEELTAKVTLYERMNEHLLTRTILHVDETTFQVLSEPGRAATAKSYLWLYRTGDISIVLYDYQPTRTGEHPKRF